MSAPAPTHSDGSTTAAATTASSSITTDDDYDDYINPPYRPDPAIIAEEHARSAILLARPSTSDNFLTFIPSHAALQQHIRLTDPDVRDNKNDYYCQLYDEAKIRLKSLLGTATSTAQIKAFLRLRQQYATSQHGNQYQVEIGFHGTEDENVTSILTRGFIMPSSSSSSSSSAAKNIAQNRRAAAAEMSTAASHSSRARIGVTNGSRYGRGIYLTPHLSMAARWGTISSIFVCLVLRGRSCEVKEDVEGGDAHTNGKCTKGYDSHHSPEGDQWCLFDPACIVPIYMYEQVNPLGLTTPAAASSASSSTTSAATSISSSSSATTASSSSSSSSSSKSTKDVPSRGGAKGKGKK